MNPRLAISAGVVLTTLALSGAGVTDTDKTSTPENPGNLEVEATGPGYASLDAAAEPLRARFNADVDKTRILMYVSPT